MLQVEDEVTFLESIYQLILSWEINETTSLDNLGGAASEAAEAGGILPTGDDTTRAPEFYSESN